MAVEPPFEEKYKAIFQNSADQKHKFPVIDVFEEFELPLIDLSRLNLGQSDSERQKCIEQIGKAAREWGFFQIVNHGIPEELLERLKHEQRKVFHQPFGKKAENNFLNLSAHSYRWGNPLATSLRNLSWSEALHISLKDTSNMDEFELSYHLPAKHFDAPPALAIAIDTDASMGWPGGAFATTVTVSIKYHPMCFYDPIEAANKAQNIYVPTLEDYATRANLLARRLAECLAQNLGIKANYFKENCTASSSSLRLNRYPPCPHYCSRMFGIIPHTDSDFITILSQDQVGGLQLKRDGRWVGVKPNPKALVINIGDLFEALSNGIYKSITHRVVANEKVERYSVAYFYCPTHETVIESWSKPALYRSFSFKEYREQIQRDIKATGDKIGLSRFLL